MLGVACASGGQFGGIWRGVSAPQGAANNLLFGPDGQAVSVEVVIGEYGPDLAGVVRFFRGDSYLLPRNADAPDRECACALLHAGRADSTAGKGTFLLQGCTPGASPDQPLRVRGTLTRDGSDLLLKLQVEDTKSVADGAATAIKLLQVGGSSDIADSDLYCPLALPGGNSASGL